MKVMILAAFLVSVQTSPPARKQTADNAAVKQSSPAPLQTAPDTDISKPNSESPNLDKPQSVRITELPAVSVNHERIDWQLWLFNGLLVIVGFLQVLLLKKTLTTINRQADIAENQKTLMEQAGQQTERIITQMKDTAQRELRAYMGISKIFLNLDVPSLPKANVETKNFGQTPAYKVRQWVGIMPHEHPLTVPLIKSPDAQKGSSTVVPSGIPQSQIVGLKKQLPLNITFGPAGVTIYVYGEITYEDIFGVERHTTFRFIYGGPEPLVAMRDANGILQGVMNPDMSGNEAD
jgi:hypothetical protein